MAEVGIGWREVVQSLTRPYRVTVPMVLLVSLIPIYLVLPSLALGPMHRPALALDHAIPVRPTWALIYGALYLWLIVVPVVLVRETEHIRRTVFAYLAVWLPAYVCFVVYPTEAPRPEQFVGKDFAGWGLELLYGADPPYNCFPSLHVAHSFVSAFAVYRVHERVGVFAIVSASLVAVSTLFTRQHYVLDVLAGVALALVAHGVFLRHNDRREIPGLDRRLAPVLASVVMILPVLGLLGFWIAYRIGSV